MPTINTNQSIRILHLSDTHFKAAALVFLGLSWSVNLLPSQSARGTVSKATVFETG
jgi:hypothetical protein